MRRETPATPLVRAGRGFDPRLSHAEYSKTKAPPACADRAFVFEYWWRRTVRSLRDRLNRRIGEPLRLQAQRRFAGSPHAARNPGYAPRPCRTRIRSRLSHAEYSKTKPHQACAWQGFVFEYW